MAKGIEFKGQNILFLKPPDMTDEECNSLPAFFDGESVISCWRLSNEELERIIDTGVVWLSVMGRQIPPLLITAFPPSPHISSDVDK